MVPGRAKSPTSESGPPLALEDVVVSYSGLRALDRLTVEFQQGVSVVLGKNGAGKSTLCRLIAGVARPDTGRLLAYGDPVDSPSSIRRLRKRTGWLPQSGDLPQSMTCREYLELACWFKEVPPRQRRDAVNRSLATVDLADSAGRRVRELSGGMQRRLGIAHTLVAAPDMLVLDEPTVGLDPEQRSGLHGVLTSLAAEGVVIVVSTHLLEDVSVLQGSVVVMDSGRSRFCGSSAEFLKLGGSADGDSWQRAFRSAISGAEDG